jgi:hypothetical protein
VTYDRINKKEGIKMVMSAIDLKNPKKTETILEDPKINVKLKLSALWATNMFIFIYVDYFGLYIPGVLENIIKGEVAHTGLEVSQAFLLFGIILMIIPSLMIFLSLALPAKANRWTNIIVGIGYSIVLVGGLVGEYIWYYYRTWAYRANCQVCMELANTGS